MEDITGLNHKPKLQILDLSKMVEAWGEEDGNIDINIRCECICLYIYWAAGFDDLG